MTKITKPEVTVVLIGLILMIVGLVVWGLGILFWIGLAILLIGLLVNFAPGPYRHRWY